MTRIPSFTHTLRSSKPTVHLGLCPKKPQSEAGRILRIPRYDRPEPPKKPQPYYICPDWLGHYAKSANDNSKFVN